MNARNTFLPFLTAMMLGFSAHAEDQDQYSISFAPSRRSEGSNAYASSTFGNGSADEGGDMEWRSLEVRFGRKLNGSLVDGGQTRIDFYHYNEGHPANNHRDGFGGQVVIHIPLADRVAVEAGAGPYYSFNTTTVNGKELNDKNLGVVTTAALLYYLNNRGLHVRAQYNFTAMPGAYDSHSFLVGLGQDFTGGSQGGSYGANQSTWISMMGGTAKTNHGGTEGATGGQIEVGRTISQNFAISLAGIKEGDDGSRVDRNGVAVQGWYVQPLTDKWTASAGVGPYVATNQRGSGDMGLNGIISVRAERTIGKKQNGLTLFVDFSRVVSRDQNDRDLARIGVRKKF